MKKDDVILVRTFAGIEVSMRLTERIEVPLSADGNWGGFGRWKAKLIYKTDLERLRKAGVPVRTLEHESWVFDWQIVRVDEEYLDTRYLDKAIEGYEVDYEEEIELYRTYGGD